MITSTHSIIYASDPDRARSFFRDVLGLAYVDAHDGWLIFKLPPSELAFHPDGGGAGGAPLDSPDAGRRRHELYLMCDDITQTARDLTAKGVEFTEPVTQTSFGMMTAIRIPGGGEIGLYEPRHRTAYDI